MEYRSIDAFLDKFRSLIQSSGLEKGAIVEAVKHISGFEIEPSLVKITGTVLYINVMGTKKAALLLHKEALLLRINQSRKRPLLDIR